MSKNFNELFDKWAESYDLTVYGENHEYKEVFENYSLILKRIAENIEDKISGNILEIGVGTGNLTGFLHNSGFKCFGIEPSNEMKKIAAKKHPDIEIIDGHFLDVKFNKKFDAIVTSYAFHHLLLEEKKEAINYLSSFLTPKGKIVIADTMFESQEYKDNLHNYVKNCNASNLLADLQSEFYELRDDILNIFENNNFSYTKEKINKYVWIITASKKE